MRTESNHDQPVSYRARWLVPIDQPPIGGGIVTVRGGRIIAVGKTGASGKVQDLGDVALLPGLVNAHTHLEFSLLAEPLGRRGMGFSDWIRAVVAWRRAGQGTAGFRVQAAIEQGLAESAAAGVVAVGEIAMPGTPLEVYSSQPGMAVVALLELLGRKPEQVQPLIELAEKHTAAARALGKNMCGGLSPHATYTVHSELLRQACELSQREQTPLAMHIAESREELELLSDQTGSLVDLLNDFGVWEPYETERGTRPLDYLKSLATAHRALVIHGNYLDHEEIAFVAAKRETMSVVYCPRTHAYFGHEPYRLAPMLAAGVRIAVGTDSRASNPDLNLFEELKHIARQHPSVSPAEVMRMGTLAAAEALGISDQYGSITPGKSASLATVPLPQNGAEPLEEVLFGSGAALPFVPFRS